MNLTEQDRDLLKGLAKQDRESIEKIYKYNFPMVQNMILNNKGNLDDAADIFQESMIVLYEKALDPGFELNCLLKTYLYSICRRLWLKKLQQTQRSGMQTDDFEQVVAVDEEVEDHEKAQAGFDIMESALKKVGEPCKSILEAYYIKKLPMHLIATEFNYTNADNAKTQKYKCLVRLKKLFFAEYKHIK